MSEGVNMTVGEVHRFYDQWLASQLGAAKKQGIVPPCREGCAECCKDLTISGEEETEYAWVHARETLKVRAWDGLILACLDWRTMARLHGFLGLSLEQLAEDGFPIRYRKAHLRCPLLDEKNRCLIYEHRPIACRGHYLLEGDASFCARDEDRGKVLSSTLFLIESGVVEYMNLLFQDRFSQLVLDGRTLP